MIKYFSWIVLFCICSVAHATLTDVDKQVIWGRNLLLNGGFENGKGTGVNKWTASAGTFATTTSGSNLLDGKVSFTWDAAAANDTLSYGQITVPNGLKGKNGVFAMKLMTPSGTATNTLILTDGTLTLASRAIISSTTPQYNFVNFIWPSSGYVIPKLLANADEPSITGDSAWLGDANETNLTNISQATFIGSAYMATTASCTGWARTNTALGAFSTDTDCPGPTIEFNPGPGVIQTTDTDLPQFTVNNLPPGYYIVEITAQILQGASARTNLAINDGTTTSGDQSSDNASTTRTAGYVRGVFNYTTAGNRTFSLFGSSSTGAISIDNSVGNNKITFKIIRYPISTDIAYNPSTSANSWSGYHDNTCSFARTNTAYGDPAADTTCAFTERLNTNFGTVTSYLSGSDKLPGIVFTPSKAQKYYVEAKLKWAGGTLASHMDARLWDGTTTIDEEQEDTQVASYIEQLTLSGIYSATSTAAKTISIQIKSSTGSSTIAANGTTNASAIEWTIFAIDQQLPAPLLVNTVVSTYNGVITEESAALNCDSGAAITSQLGSWVSSIGNISAGACAVTLISGVFSATPYCQFTGNNANPLIVSVNPTSSTAVTIDCDGNDGTDCSTYDGTLTCRGPK